MCTGSCKNGRDNDKVCTGIWNNGRDNDKVCTGSNVTMVEIITKVCTVFLKSIEIMITYVLGRDNDNVWICIWNNCRDKNKVCTCIWNNGTYSLDRVQTSDCWLYRNTSLKDIQFTMKCISK